MIIVDKLIIIYRSLIISYERGVYMEYTYKQIQDYFYNNNLEQSDTIFNDMDSIAYVLCEVLTSSEKARAKKGGKERRFLHLWL